MPYIPFTEEEKQLANSVDLAEFLRQKGEKLERAGREYKLIYTDGTGSHDSITISGSTWFDHKNQVGGGAIKFMQYHYGMNFQAAMNELLGKNMSEISRTIAKNIPKQKPHKEFTLPKANENMHRVYAYLIKQRYIDSDIITHFVHAHMLYEDKEHHNAVFVGVDEKGVPRQAHKRGTSTYGKSFRQTVEGSDTKYSFAHFGKSNRLYVFEAPIDMLSYLTLHPENWQNHSYIAINGVYESAVLTALKNHSALNEIFLCVDSDEGGVEAEDRLRDILIDNGYSDVTRLAPVYKDWNEVLKAQRGVDAQPALPHKRKEQYLSEVQKLEHLKCRPDKLFSQIYATFKNGQYIYLAEYALAGSAFFIAPKSENAVFHKLQDKLMAQYKPYTDKGKLVQKQQNLQDSVKSVMRDLKQTARTHEQTVQTSKLLYQLADNAMRVAVEEIMCAPKLSQSEDMSEEDELCMSPDYG